MKNAPIPAVLDLWALGYSASEIARRFKFPNFRHVARIVAHARSIGDPRAAIHRSGNPRKALGLLRDRPEMKVIEVVIVRCRRGHRLIRPIVGASGRQCRKCKNEIHRLYYERNRERKLHAANLRYQRSRKKH